VEDIAGGSAAENATTVSWSPVQQLCLEKYEHHLRRGGPVTITGEELKKLGDPEKLPFARSSYLFGALYANTAADADNGVYTFALQSMGGPSAANLLGRFCSGDPHLAGYVHTALAAEEAAYPDVIFAEVVHFPEARAANVLIRPPLRQYEIPYIGMAGVPAACQLPVSDLMVSVQDNEVVLRSKRLDKRVIPRLSSAHNYSFNSLPVYKFLCDLQHQSLVSHLFWDWGILAGRPSLPRVTYKNIILCRATWTITQKDLEPAGDKDTDPLQHFEQYRQQQGIPNRVLLSDADNELLLDFTQPIAVALLLDHIKRANTATLKEFLAEEQHGMLRDEGNEVYAHELLVPLLYTSANNSPLPLAASAPAKQPAPGITRSFAPGSEWMYLKIYCGYRVAEELLAGYFAEQIPLWQEDGLFEQFFFLRYGDPQPHIRLRFLNKAHPANNDVLLHRIQTALQPYIRSGQVQKVQCDTYVREIERYTAAAMLQSEELFFADSIAVLGIISLLEGPAGEDYRWKLALRGMDSLLDDFGLTLPERKELLAALRAVFVTEFGGGELLHKPLNDKYRKHQQQIMSYMNAADDEQNDISEAVDFFQQRTQAARPLALQMRTHCGSPEVYLHIIASHLHMFMNRLFIGKQRKYELVLYHFLEKYYLSQLALVAVTK
jgi:thiopeptide-type bacteriocin biosynthesis protein